MTLRFILPSSVGVLIFLTPVVQDDRQTLVFGVLTGALGELLRPALEEILVALLVTSAIVTPLWPLLRSSALGRVGALGRWFDVHWLWTVLRVAGALAAAAVYLDVGPELVRGDDTGGVIFRDICIPVMLIYLVSVFLMGLLTDYGLMEFIGALMHRPFQALFRLPGRASIDAVASFVSASGLGVLITVRQYELGRYTAREACIICCSFSVVSIPFALLIADVAGIAHLFFVWYLSLIFACVVAAAVITRVGVLANKPETVYGGGEPLTGKVNDSEGAGSALSRGFAAATARAATAMSPRQLLRFSALQCGDLLLGVLGPIMAIGTLASIIVFRTPIFDVLALPISWLLGLGGFPEAAAAGKGFLVGVLDQFMPALVAQGLESEYARFVLAGLSVAQLIYFSEYGLLMLRSPLPITVVDLLLTFALRTVVVTPIILVAAWLAIETA